MVVKPQRGVGTRLQTPDPGAYRSRWLSIPADIDPTASCAAAGASGAARRRIDAAGTRRHVPGGHRQRAANRGRFPAAPPRAGPQGEPGPPDSSFMFTFQPSFSLSQPFVVRGRPPGSLWAEIGMFLTIFWRRFGADIAVFLPPHPRWAPRFLFSQEFRGDAAFPPPDAGEHVGHRQEGKTHRRGGNSPPGGAGERGGAPTAPPGVPRTPRCPRAPNAPRGDTRSPRGGDTGSPTAGSPAR